jgi:hypothetical protein
MPVDYSQFGERDADWWHDWLRNFFDRNRTDPPFPVIQEGYYQAAQQLYDHLPSRPDRDHFAEGVSMLFESTPNDAAYAERLLYLIDIVSAITPIRCKRMLRERLSSHLFRPLVYGETRLYWTALSALSEYDVDQQTIELVLRVSEQLHDISFGLVCARVLARTHNARLGYGFLNRLVPLLTEANVMQFRVELRPIVKRLGRFGIVQWYQQDVLGWGGAQLGVRFPAQTALLAESLAKVFPWKRWSDATDPYQIIAAAQFSSRNGNLSVADVMMIARLHDVVDSEVLISLLRSMYLQNLPNTTWDLLVNSDTYGKPGVCLLYSNDEVLELSAESEPVTVSILKKAHMRAMGPEEVDARAAAEMRLPKEMWA